MTEETITTRLFTIFFDQSKREGALTLELDLEGPYDQPLWESNDAIVAVDKDGKRWTFERFAVTHSLMSDLTAAEYAEFLAEVAQGS